MKSKKMPKRLLKAGNSLELKKTVMLTGDRKSVAEQVANDLGIDEVYSDLPADKSRTNGTFICREI